MCDLAYTITIIKNHEPVWERDHLKETLGDIEHDKYDTYKELKEQKKREKYAPKLPRFSEIGVKRTFSSMVWNNEGMIYTRIIIRHGRLCSRMIISGSKYVTVGIHGCGRSVFKHAILSQCRWPPGGTSFTT